MADERSQERIDALEARLTALERAVRELAAARAATADDAGRGVMLHPQTAPGAPMPPSVPPAPTPPPPRYSPPSSDAHRFRAPDWLRTEVDVESLVGRYGTLVLATVSALAAVGTFLGWAISQGLLGPAQRIVLGLVVAAALAVAGFRLRRTERSFGASLLGLALAITHVCAWGAGPSLRLVPGWAAFLLAALASGALAVFAHNEDDEPLWSVGFSGAAIAPFVTASGRGNLLLLSAYGVLVLTAAGYAMGGRRWIVAGRLFLLAAAVFTLGLATGYERDLGPVYATGFPLAVALSGVMPWIAGWRRRERLRALGALAALAALRTALSMQLPWEKARVAAFVAGCGILWLLLVDRTHDTSGEEPGRLERRIREGDWLDGAVLPLAFVLASLIAFDASGTLSGVWLLGAAGVLFVTIVRLPSGALRDSAVFAIVIAAVVGVVLVLDGRPLAIIAAMAAMSVACLAANHRWTSVSWTMLGAVGLVWSLIASLAQLIERVPYRYVPFGSAESGIALIVLVALVAAWRLARDARLTRGLLVAIIAWAFVWVHQEIAFAFNPTAATLLRVTYYATTSVVAVGIGRQRAVPILRHIGLGLGVLAAGTALVGARKLDAVGARVGADLVAAVFLLGIAYWYRRPGAASTRAAPDSLRGV